MTKLEVLKKDKYVVKILKKMCKVVGAKYSELDFTAPDWFMKYSWTEKQEDKFREWLIKTLKTDGKMRRHFRVHTTATKHLKKYAAWWCFDHGWTYKK